MGAITFAKAIEKKQIIADDRVIYLGENNIGNLGIEALATALEKNPNNIKVYLRKVL